MKTEIFLIIFLIWNLIISWFLWRTIKHYRALTKGVKKGNLEKILESFLKEEKLVNAAVKEVKSRIKELGESNEFCFRKIGLVKFNPFSELGGNQSFSLAILNDQEKGLIITGLHGRQTTRVYTKLINGQEVKLSEEELRAIKKAKKGK